MLRPTVDIHRTLTAQSVRFHAHRLEGNWNVKAELLEGASNHRQPPFALSLTVPDSTHLQPVLFPDQPYWGERLRAVNEYAWTYQRTFTLPHADSSHARLRFDGVDYFAEVWLNGHFIGKHEGHFAPFTFDVSDHVKRDGSENLLMVRVTSPWDAPNPGGNYPADHVLRGLVKGHYEHGEGVIPPNVNPLGIWRPVWLLLDDGLSIDHIRIQTTLEGNMWLQLRVVNATEQTWDGKLILQVEGDNHSGSGVLDSADLHLAPGEHVVEQTLHVSDPQLWWPWDHGEPNLYRVRAYLVDHQNHVFSATEETFAFRTVHLRRTPERFEYRVNGRPVFIRGTGYMPGLYLSQCDQNLLMRDVQLAREANLNLLRVHVHVSPPELYDICDRLGMLVWQDFELNWIHDASLEFEQRARAVQRDMIDMLGNHPSVITWCCHNEPTMFFTRRQNLEKHPGPALYTDAMQQDPTRPVFLCSGQMDNDWQRSGDSHSYYGAIWSGDYTDVYRFLPRLSTEFGFEAPASKETLQQYAYCWERQSHLEEQIDELWAYQAELTQYHVEHFRRLRATSCAGYIHFWLVDLVPQVGCGVLDSQRIAKGGYDALRRASSPLHIALEHDGRKPIRLWVFNDTMQTYAQCTMRWQIFDAHGKKLLEGQLVYDVASNASQPVMDIQWSVASKKCAQIKLTLLDSNLNPLAENHYENPFQHRLRPDAYPWKFDFELGTKVFNREGAPSMMAGVNSDLLTIVPLQIQETVAEWGMRRHFPHKFISRVARVLDWVTGVER